MNRLSHYRSLRGWSAARLAQASGVTRQTIYAIEAGTFAPNTTVALRLGKLLNATVEELFGEEQAPEEYDIEPLGGLQDGGFARVARVGSVLVAAPPAQFEWPAADGIVHGKRIRLFSDSRELEEQVVVAGCDPAIGVLARRQGIALVPVNCSSTRALDLLKNKRVHVAGSHIGDEALPRKRVRVVTFASWEEGLAIAPGNPKSIAAVEDLARRGISIVNREPGAGARILLDRELKKSAVPVEKVRGYDKLAAGHLEAAWYVSAGLADACVVTRAAARAFGLDFVPYATERYDLVIPTSFTGWKPLERMLDALASAAVRRELAALAGYDTSATGRATELA